MVCTYHIAQDVPFPDQPLLYHRRVGQCLGSRSLGLVLVLCHRSQAAPLAAAGGLSGTIALCDFPPEFELLLTVSDGWSQQYTKTTPCSGRTTVEMRQLLVSTKYGRFLKRKCDAEPVHRCRTVPCRDRYALRAVFPEENQLNHIRWPRRWTDNCFVRSYNKLARR